MTSSEPTPIPREAVQAGDLPLQPEPAEASVSQPLVQATLDVQALLSALLVARGRIVMANPKADTRDLDAVLLGHAAPMGSREEPAQARAARLRDALDYVAGYLEAACQTEAEHGLLMSAEGLLSDVREFVDLDEQRSLQEGSCGADAAVVIDYTNWRGVRGERTVRPLELWWGATEYHPEPQFLLRALDLAKGEVRDFAMADIHAWRTGAAPANTD